MCGNWSGCYSRSQYNRKLIDERNSLNRPAKKMEKEEQDGLREELSQQEVMAG